MADRPAGKQHRPATEPDTKDQLPGLVIVNYGRNLLVESPQGNLHLCVTRRGLDKLVCGDHVRWQQTGDEAGVVESLDPRHSTLYRSDAHDRQKPLAANIDRIVIESAPEPPLEPFLLDKYLVAAELASITPVVVFNKSDLLDATQRKRLESLADDYSRIDYSCLFTSALKNSGIDEFRQLLTGCTSVLVGQSGVGKSSLIKRLIPDQDIAIGKLSAASGQGKHTTTATTLYHLPDGGNLIDSPGVRDFRLGQVDASELARGFREFTPHLGNCRFNDCLHKGEPGCAVQDALAQGKISERRMESYLRLL